MCRDIQKLIYKSYHTDDKNHTVTSILKLIEDEKYLNLTHICLLWQNSLKAGL